MNFVYDPKVAASSPAYINYVTPGEGTMEALAKTDPKTADEPADLPDGRDALQVHLIDPDGAEEPGATTSSGRPCSAPEPDPSAGLLPPPPRAHAVPPARTGPGLAGASSSSSRSGSSPTSRSSRARSTSATRSTGPGATTGTRSSRYHEQLYRSLLYAGLATVLALLISYPLAYWIAFRGGRWKNLLLVMIIAPFFVTYLIRTLAWQTILADEGPVVGHLPRRRDPRRQRPRCSPPRPPSSPASPTTSCPSWRCRSTSRSSRSTSG